MKNIKESFNLIGEVKWIKRNSYTKSGRKAYGRGKIITQSPWMKNKIMASSGRGLYILLDRLIGINTYSGNITHADLGTDNTAPADGDTGLTAPVARTSVTDTGSTGSQRTFRFYFNNALTPNNTYKEFGMFIDGTSTVNTGRIFNHIILGVPLVKATGEDNTILVRITGSNT